MKSVFSTLLSLSFILLVFMIANAAQTDIVGPPGSGTFGATITVLPNGNIVVVDTGYDAPGPINNVGAVYLYNGATLTLISSLTGSTGGDAVGSGGITVLTNGNFVVISPTWDNPSVASFNAGAVTWCSQTTGCGGPVSAANSLVGVTPGDAVGDQGVRALTNGNYVVSSPSWNSVTATDVGAVTWCNGTGGTVGQVSAANSLIGSTTGDSVGNTGVAVLTNGNYVVRNTLWDSPSPLTTNVGAVTWGNGAGGTVGVVSAANSLIGTSTNDQIGNGGVTTLTNGNYVVRSLIWDNPSPPITDVGAVAWGNGLGGTVGPVSAANALIGSSPTDQIGSGTITALTNGNYVVTSQNWDNPAPVISNVGAVTWGNGTSGTVGVVSSANSLIGSTAADFVGGTFGVTALTNGNYVVRSVSWNNGAANDAGAVTWGNGTVGTVGELSAGNSLVGTASGNQVGSGGITALTNGNYVVSSISWDDGAVTDAGAVTWGNGAAGTVGAVSAANSLIGSTISDGVGGVTALGNGDYVVNSVFWDNPSGAIADAGAVTWGSGTGGPVGAVSAANSLIGGTAGDEVGRGVTALTNGNYVVRSPNWDNPSPVIANVGAVTWGNGSGGTTGTVSAANSLIGATVNDQVGAPAVIALTNGNYVVCNSDFDNPSPLISNVGAVTWGSGISGISGVVSSSNSLIGVTASDLVGNNSPVAATNGNYAFRSPNWDNPSGAVVNASAVTFGTGSGGMSGLITSGLTGGNSVIGTASSDAQTFALDPTRNRLVVGRGATNTFSVLFFTTTAIADGDVANAANWDNGVPNGLATGIIPSGRSMTISSVINAGQIRVECAGNLTGGSASAYVVGSVRKDFCSASNDTFTYPIGDPSNYSPLTVSNANGSGDLTASVTDTFMPGLPATTKSLSRYWSLSGAGITTNLTFSYTTADVNGTESDYKVFRRPLENNALVTPVGSTVDTANNTVTAFNVSQFSDWSASAQQFVPTAAGGEIAGRVTTSGGIAVRNAVVTISGGTLPGPRTVRTGSFGYYRFEDLAVGETYIVSVGSKRYRFVNEARVVNLLENAFDIDFVTIE